MLRSHPDRPRRGSPAIPVNAPACFPGTAMRPQGQTANPSDRIDDPSDRLRGASMSGIRSKSNDAEIQSAGTMTESVSRHEDVACTMCGCVCDDLRVHVREGNIVSTEGACSLAQPFFSSQKSQDSWPSFFRGASVDFAKALDEAAGLLRASKAPLIYGLSRSSSAGQRQAVRLADALGATIDTTASTCHAPSIIALQQVGESTCSLGEARHHCDLCIFWGSNPVRSHPRHAERYSVEPSGQFLAR